MGNKYFYISLVMLFFYTQSALTSDVTTRRNDILRILSAWQNTAKELNKKRESIVAMFKEKKIDRTAAQQGTKKIRVSFETEKNTAQNIIGLLINQPNGADLSTVNIETANIYDLAEKLASE